jgi:hypothetical protein
MDILKVHRFYGRSILIFSEFSIEEKFKKTKRNEKE